MAEEKKEVKKEALWKRAWDKYEEAFDFVVEHRVGLAIFGIAVGVIALNKKVDKLDKHLNSLDGSVVQGFNAINYNFDVISKEANIDSGDLYKYGPKKDGGDI